MSLSLVTRVVCFKQVRLSAHCHARRNLRMFLAPGHIQQQSAIRFQQGVGRFIGLQAQYADAQCLDYKSGVDSAPSAQYG